ncbi:SE1561 family protein [Salibacterium salarium]|uniref:SE1561 family protein n=1 Tax=Salibacterium salarium TaxID=284579 RepID=UPI00115FE8B0|nr:SE1561 family protein [Salibacterium salarium]
MGTPVYDKSRQIQYLKQRVHLIQQMLEHMEDSSEVERSDLDRLEDSFRKTELKIKQFKQDWD